MSKDLYMGLPVVCIAIVSIVSNWLFDAALVWIGPITLVVLYVAFSLIREKEKKGNPANS